MNVFNFVLFIHIISATSMGFYLIIPYLLLRLRHLTMQSQIGYLRVLISLNRIGQYALILEIISGSYLFSQLHLDNLWTGLMGLFVLGVGAAAGFLGVRMKKALSQMQTQENVPFKFSRLTSLGWLAGISFFVVIVLMCFRNHF
jgi:hypothetical protein